jgi:hypothetical protein
VNILERLAGWVLDGLYDVYKMLGPSGFIGAGIAVGLLLGMVTYALP